MNRMASFFLFIRCKRCHLLSLFIILSMVSILCACSSATKDKIKKEFSDQEIQKLLSQTNNVNNMLQNISDEELEYLNIQAEAGDPFAMQLLGRLYLIRSGQHRNVSKGLMWIKKAASHGDETSLFVLARIYINGTIVEQDIPHAVTLLKQSFDKGNILAMIDLGILYEYGIGVPQDMGQALKYYLMASKGDELSYSDYANGVLYKGEMEQALYLFRLSIGIDDTFRAEAMQRIAEFNKEGIYIPKHLILAYVWYSLSKELYLSPKMETEMELEIETLSKELSDAELIFAKDLTKEALKTLRESTNALHDPFHYFTKYLNGPDKYCKSCGADIFANIRKRLGSDFGPLLIQYNAKDLHRYRLSILFLEPPYLNELEPDPELLDILIRNAIKIGEKVSTGAENEGDLAAIYVSSILYKHKIGKIAEAEYLKKGLENRFKNNPELSRNVPLLRDSEKIIYRSIGEPGIVY